MYTWEIEKFLAERNRIVTRDEFYKVVNELDNPQIENVEYQGRCRHYVIKTKDGKDMDVLVKKTDLSLEDSRFGSSTTETTNTTQ